MDIVLQNNLLLIRTDFATLKEPWADAFLNAHAESMLYLPSAVLVLENGAAYDVKEAFLQRLSERYAQAHELDRRFFHRALMRCLKKPVRIEIDSPEEPETVTVELFARDPHTVTATLYARNTWVMRYLHAQMSRYVRSATDLSLELDMSELKAKSRLERTLNKRHLLQYRIQYRYDALFMQRLYSDYAGFEFDEEEQHDQIDEMMHYYTVLECPVGASQDALKKSYKKLVRVYHPDRVHCENDAMIDRYTRKFQLLQEAYTALRIVS